MTLLRYVEKHLDDFDKKTIMDVDNKVIFQGKLQDIPFEIPIHKMEVIKLIDNGVVVKMIS